MDIKAEIDRAMKACSDLEQLVVQHEPLVLDERGALLVGHWNLMIEYHTAITLLLKNELCGSAFALVRPMVEAWLGAHLVVSADNKVVESIRKDTYRTNFEDVSSQIDEAFNLSFFKGTLNKRVQKAMHSYTHSGLRQIARRFEGTTIKQSFTDAEKWDTVRLSTLALAMTTVLVTKTLRFDVEWTAANHLCSAYSNELNRPNSPA